MAPQAEEEALEDEEEGAGDKAPADALGAAGTQSTHLHVKVVSGDVGPGSNTATSHGPASGNGRRSSVEHGGKRGSLEVAGGKRGSMEAKRNSLEAVHKEGSGKDKDKKKEKEKVGGCCQQLGFAAPASCTA